MVVTKSLLVMWLLKWSLSNVYCLCDVKLSNNHLFQEKKKEEAEFEIAEDASDTIEEHIDDQGISLAPLNMEDMRHAKNKVVEL